jgi:hypothetical protein
MMQSETISEKKVSLRTICQFNQLNRVIVSVLFNWYLL